MGRSKIPEGRKILLDAREREREEEGLEKRLKAVVIRELFEKEKLIMYRLNVFPSYT